MKLGIFNGECTIPRHACGWCRTHPGENGYPVECPHGITAETADSQPKPGTELKKLLASFGIYSTPQCQCLQVAKQMDLWGARCNEHLEEIVNVMAAEARARGWNVGPFAKLGARGLVLLAIRNAGS